LEGKGSGKEREGKGLRGAEKERGKGMERKGVRGGGHCSLAQPLV